MFRINNLQITWNKNEIKLEINLSEFGYILHCLGFIGIHHCIFAPLITYIREKARKANNASNKRANNIGKFVNLAPNMFRLHFKFTRCVAGMFKKTVYLSSFMPIKNALFTCNNVYAHVFTLAYTQLFYELSCCSHAFYALERKMWMVDAIHIAF